MNQKAAALFNNDQQQAAVKLLVQAIDEDGQDIDNYLQLATYLTTLKDYDQAEELLKKALHQFPDNLDLMYNLGVLYYEIEAFPLAEQQFQKLVKQKADTENYLMLARIYYKQQNYAKAMAFALTAHDQDPKAVAPNIMLGDSLLSMGRLKQAKPFYLKAHELAPDNMESLFGAGVVAFILDRDDRLLEEVKAKNPEYYQKQTKRLSEIEQFLKTK